MRTLDIYTMSVSERLDIAAQSADSEILLRLASYDDNNIRLLVSRNRHCHSRLLELLARDKDPLVRDSSQKKLSSFKTQN